MARCRNIIQMVNADSIAQELGIEEGDCLLSIDHLPVFDVFDYRLRSVTPALFLEIEKKNGERIEFDIEKEEYEELGIEFSEPLMDASQSCANKCMFCFIDQLPSGMRTSLYFKDDDLRLSFLTGNYVTLTNIDDKELDRLISYRLSPMNISVHTTDPDLRVRMMKNKNAGRLLDQLKKITLAGIWINCQIVLCPGINDGQALDRTLADLFDLGDKVKSIALVPVGLTRYRIENSLEDIRPFDRRSAAKAIETALHWQQVLLKERRERVVYASDELYIKAGMSFPPAEEYEEFPQLENGVGMVSLFIQEIQDGITRRMKKAKRAKSRTAKNSDSNVLLITGVDARPVLEQFTAALSDLYGSTFHAEAIPNRFFGETVTVAGLVTGADIVHERMKRTKPRVVYERAIIPGCMLRSGETVFLDDMSLIEVEEATGIPITCADPTGEGLLRVLDKLFP